MQALNVIIAQGDYAVAESLAESLHSYYRSISIVRSSDELRSLLDRFHPDAAVIDLETIDLSEIANLCHRFSIPVIATHRIPDELIWTDAMSAGAVDCCDRQDVRNIVATISRSVHDGHRYARAA